jgi:antitoxin VapB
MPLSIKNPAAERLVREVAKQTGESLTEAIQKSLEERLHRLKVSHKIPIVQTQLEDLLRRVDELPTIDTRSADEILGYDENGLPR